MANKDFTVTSEKLDPIIDDLSSVETTLKTAEVSKKSIASPENPAKKTVMGNGLKDTKSTEWEKIYASGGTYLDNANSQLNSAAKMINAVNINFTNAIERKNKEEGKATEKSESIRDLIKSGNYTFSLKNTKTVVANGITSLSGLIVARNKKTGEEKEFPFNTKLPTKKEEEKENTTPSNNETKKENISQEKNENTSANANTNINTNNSRANNNQVLTQESKGTSSRGRVTYTPKKNTNGGASSTTQTQTQTSAVETPTTPTDTKIDSKTPITNEKVKTDTTDLFDDGAATLIDDTPANTSGGNGSILGTVAAAAGIAGAAGIGVKLYKDRKENSDLDLDEDRPSNGNKFWTDEESNVINSEKDSYSDDDRIETLSEAKQEKYKAADNGLDNNDDEEEKRNLSDDSWAVPPTKSVDLFES